MELENYFDFVSDTEIRIKGTRIYIDNILRPYLDGISPDELLIRFDSVSPEKLYATLTYYYANKDEVNAYIERVIKERQERYEKYQSENAERIQAMRERFDKFRSEQKSKAV